MSETTAAPAAPAEAPAGAPPSQERLSLSDAARMLAQRRIEARQQGAPAAPAESTPRVETGLSAMERALGVPDSGATAPEAATAAAPMVDIDGTPHSVEALRAALGQAADYTRKTQELAEQRRQLESQQQALAEVLPLLQSEIQRLTTSLQEVAPPDPTLIDANPQEYLRQQRQYENALREQQRLLQLGQLQQQARERTLAQQVAAANEQLAKELPFWADPAERAKAQQEIVTWALDKAGFTRDELRGLADPRALKLMMKAMQFDKWVSGSRTVAPRPQVPGAPVRGMAPPAPPAERVQMAEQAFEARPNVRNAAALLTARRGNGGF